LSAKPLLVVRAQVNPEIFAEFERWYLREHIHHMLQIPGIVAAYRARSPRNSPNWMTIFKFSGESVVQDALASPEADRARQDWERWLPYVSEVTVEVYNPLMPLPAYRHWN
jgi:antibiotic biosynthesis monooxygenase (ABM) superfamily enzyme